MPTNAAGCRSYGPGVVAWAAALDTGRDVVLADPAGAAEAVLDAIARRSRGEAFFFGPALEATRAAVAVQIGAAIADSDRDARFTIMDQLASGELRVNDREVGGLTTVPHAQLATLKTAATLSCGLYFRSHAQRELFRTMCGDIGVPAAIRPGVPPPLDVAPARGQNIVVYAPSEPPERATLIAAALADLPRPVVVVASRAGTLGNLAARVVGPQDAAAELARAAVIVEGTIGDPVPLLALRELVLPVAVASTTGSAEFWPGASIFDPWHRASIVAAVLLALGNAPSLPRAFQSEDSPPVPPAPRHGPRVSIVIPTYNRRDLLVHALDSAVAQQYDDFEVIVVDDCSAVPVRDIVAAYGDRVRLIRNERNLGLPGSRNAGAAAATGTYLAFLDDDDQFFPDHLASLVAALERSGAAAANSDAVTRFLRKLPDGSYRVRGYLSESARSFDYNDVLVTNAAPPVTVMIRRYVFEQLGGFDASMRICLEDHDMWLRVARAYDFVHVNRVTAVYSRRDDGSNMISYTGAQHAGVLLELYARYPAGSRDLVLQRRRQTIEMLRATGTPPIPQPPIEFDEPFVRL